MAQNPNVPRSQEYYMGNRGQVNKEVVQRIQLDGKPHLAALSRLDKFFLKSLNQGHAGTVPETSRTPLGTNQGTNENDSEYEPHPKTSVPQSQTTRNFGPYHCYDMVTRIPEITWNVLRQTEENQLC